MSNPFEAPPRHPRSDEDNADATRYFQDSPRERAEWADAVVLAKRTLLYQLSKDAGLFRGVTRAPTAMLLRLLEIDALNRVVDRMP